MLMLPPELQALVKEFSSMKSESSVFFSKLSDKQFNQRPVNGGWSVGECIDHLIVTGVDYCEKYESALQILREKDLRLNGTLKFSWFGKKFINFVEPPVRFKVKSPKKWRPPDSNINKTKATAAYLQLQDRWIGLINLSEGWDLAKVKLPSPASNFIKFSAFEILGVNSAHQRRHFLQAKKIFDNKK